MENDLTIMQDLTVENLEQMPVEKAIAYYDYIKKTYVQIRNYKALAESIIIRKMKNNGASKVSLGDIVYQVKPGKYMAVKDADKIWEKAGFDPLEIGKYEFKANWSAAKELYKFGGEKANVIDQIFEQTKETLEEK